MKTAVVFFPALLLVWVSQAQNPVGGWNVAEIQNSTQSIEAVSVTKTNGVVYLVFRNNSNFGLADIIVTGIWDEIGANVAHESINFLESRGDPTHPDGMLQPGGMFTIHMSTGYTATSAKDIRILGAVFVNNSTEGNPRFVATSFAYWAGGAIVNGLARNLLPLNPTDADVEKAVQRINSIPGKPEDYESELRAAGFYKDWLTRAAFGHGLDSAKQVAVVQFHNILAVSPEFREQTTRDTVEEFERRWQKETNAQVGRKVR